MEYNYKLIVTNMDATVYGEDNNREFDFFSMQEALYNFEWYSKYSGAEHVELQYDK